MVCPKTINLVSAGFHWFSTGLSWFSTGLVVKFNIQIISTVPDMQDDERTIGLQCFKGYYKNNSISTEPNQESKLTQRIQLKSCIYDMKLKTFYMKHLLRNEENFPNNQ